MDKKASFAREQILISYDGQGSKTIPFPPIGICRSSRHEMLTANEIALLRKIHFTHYTVYLRLYSSNWQESFKRANNEAKGLKIPLLVVLYFGDAVVKELNEFIAVCNSIFPFVEEVIIFKKDSKITPPGLLKQILPILREGLHHVKVGVGTDSDITEITANKPEMGDSDFLTFAIAPEFNVIDHALLMENLLKQSDALNAARALSAGKQVYVTPVTFKLKGVSDHRVEEKSSELDEPTEAITSQERSLFTAGWTLGSVKFLVESGADSISYFDTNGETGIFQRKKRGLDSESVRVHPLIFVFHELLSMNNGFVIPSKSSAPLKVNAIIQNAGGKHKISIANHTGSRQVISITGPSDAMKCKILSGKEIMQFLEDPEKFMRPGDKLIPCTNNSLIIEIEPFGIVFLDE